MSETYDAQDTHRDLMTRGRPVKAEIQETYASPLDLLAERIIDYAGADPKAVNQLAHYQAFDIAGYGEADLPPDLKGPWESREYEAPPLPQSENELEPFMREYWPWRLQRSGSYYPGVQVNSSSHRQALKEALLRRIQTGAQLDPDAWRRYEDVHQAQQARARSGTGICNLILNSAMVNNIHSRRFAERRGIFEVATETYDNFLIGDTSSPYAIASPVRAPISNAYGSAFTERLARTMAFMIDFIQQDNVVLEAVCQRVGVHRDVMDRHVLRIMDSNLPGAEEGSIASFQEGIASMFSLVFLHTYEGIPGYQSDPEGGFDQLCHDDLITTTTQTAPLSFAFSMLIHGLRFASPNTYRGGRLVCSDDLITRSDAIQQKSEALIHDAWARYDAQVAGGNADAVEPAHFGGTCEFAQAYRNEQRNLMPSAISRLTTAANAVFHCITPDPPKDAIPPGLPWDIPRFVEPIEQPPLPTVAARVMALHRVGKITLSDQPGLARRPPPDI